MNVTVYQGLLEFNWNLLFSAITVLVLYVILKRFFFEKVHYFMMARQAHIEEQLAHAEETERKASVLLEEYSRTLAHAEEEKRNILRDARKEASQRAAGIVENARKEAADLTVRTRQELEHEEEKTIRRLREEIGELAVLAAEQILQRELEHGGQEELVQQVIEEARERWETH